MLENLNFHIHSKLSIINYQLSIRRMPSLWAHKRKSTQKTVLGFLSAKLLSFPELNGGAWGRAPYPWNLHSLLPQYIANSIFFENSF